MKLTLHSSTNLWPFLPAPGTDRSALTYPTSLTHHYLGADDDGSGSMSILEGYRGLLEAGFRPELTVEFHWYSAEVSHSDYCILLAYL